MTRLGVSMTTGWLAGSSAAAENAAPVTNRLIVRTYSAERVPPDTLATAGTVVRFILGHAGIEVVSRNCPSPDVAPRPSACDQAVESNEAIVRIVAAERMEGETVLGILIDRHVHPTYSK